MSFNHVHLGVRDLGTALDWLDRIWQLTPQFQNDRMATTAIATIALFSSEARLR